jgi:hypothetical protein
MNTQNEKLNNQNDASNEKWQKLEHLMGLSPGPVPPQAQGRNTNKKLVLGGMLATLTIVATCQFGMGIVSRPVDTSLVMPVASFIQESIAGVALHAQKSTLTGIVDPDTLTASLYWTLDLKNISGTDREAQAELKLPEGAVVSRATLWINGVPQEAAFNTTQQVTNAYNWITVKHRDPLLVTYKDEHTVLIKASPVPANGDIMKIRLGITAPLTIGADGRGVLTVPQLEQANFSLAERNDVHIESKQSMEPGGSLFTGRQTAAGKYLLTANVPTSDLSNVTITSAKASGLGKFAVRATHSLPGSYIFSQVNDDSDDKATQLKRSQDIPKCPVVKSEQAAHRVSTLWAAREINRLLVQGKQYEAQNLASVFRIVSPVSGAVVLELDSDYNQMGLHRDQYMVSVPGRGPIASRYQQPAGTMGQTATSNAPVLQRAFPVLQGATNGTIAPQGLDGTIAPFNGSTPMLQGAAFSGLSSAGTIVQGVNTEGTVTVNNLANMEALTTVVAKCFDIGCFMAALFFAVRGLVKTCSGGFKAGIIDQLIAISLVTCGMLWLAALPIIVAFKIVKLASKTLKGGRLVKSVVRT